METTMRKTTGLAAVLFGLTTVLAGCSDNGGVVTSPGGNAITNIPAARADQKTLEVRDNVKIVRATGDITDAVKQFRDILGALNPNVDGEQPGNRREINWDGAPDSDDFPGNFFNVNAAPRGVVFTTPGTGFRNKGNGFVNVNPAYAGEFNTFSPPKLFVAKGSTIIDVHFFVAKSNTPATVTGFGSVFADVGRAHSTTIEYFDVNDNSLLKIAAPRRSDANGLSFLGANFDSRIVARVRITAGDTPLDATTFDNVKGAGKKFDLVATDDFIFGEPRAIN
jgi:hypothetical protein